jgi:glycosyltransferase involved in cell wall biosynthesis
LQILSKHYIPAIIRRPVAYLTSLLEKWMARNCSAIVAATPSIQNKFLSIGANCITVHNFPRIDELLIDIASKPKHDFAVCYVGGIMATRGIYQLTEAMSEIDCDMHLCGSFSPPSLREEVVNRPGWKKIMEHGFLSRKEVADVYRKCDVGIVTLLPSPNYIDAYPVKMFEYMAAGLAVIASDFPLYKSIVEENKCGICVDPTDANAIKQAILSLSQNPEVCTQYGINGQQMVKSKYNWNSEAERLFKLYQAEILKAKIE